MMPPSWCYLTWPIAAGMHSGTLGGVSYSWRCCARAFPSWRLDMATRKISRPSGSVGCGGFARGGFPAPRRPIKRIDPLGIAKRVEKFERRRWQRRYARDGRRDRIKPDRRMSGSLDTHFLEKAFGWLVAEGASLLDPDEQAMLLGAFWSHEAWCLRGSADDDDGDFKSRGQFGYSIVCALARLALLSPAAKANAIWEQVFVIGPRGYHSIGAFLTEWFTLIEEPTDVIEFSTRWRPMIEFTLNNKQWATEGKWFYAQRLEREVLGFGAGGFITRAPSHAALIGGMRDLYKSLGRNALALQSRQHGRVLRFSELRRRACAPMDGLQWIAAVMRADPETASGTGIPRPTHSWDYWKLPSWKMPTN